MHPLEALFSFKMAARFCSRICRASIYNKAKKPLKHGKKKKDIQRATTILFRCSRAAFAPLATLLPDFIILLFSNSPTKNIKKLSVLHKKHANTSQAQYQKVHTPLNRP